MSEHAMAAMSIVIPMAAALGWAAMGGTAHAQAPALTSVVHAPAGDVQGLAKDGVGEFLGIPYAAPPVGELRWRPPEDAPRWQRRLQATKFGNTCVQPQRGVFAAPSNTEDCLYLNVFTPKTTRSAFCGWCPISPRSTARS
jgi:para-nitrobenzyl esterase